jgi:hypothetical protein
MIWIKPERSGGILGCWNSERRLSGFFSSIAGTVNQFHRRKATTWTQTFEQLLVVTERAFALVADGTAFETQEEAELLAWARQRTA